MTRYNSGRRIYIYQCVNLQNRLTFLLQVCYYNLYIINLKNKHLFLWNFLLDWKWSVRLVLRLISVLNIDKKIFTKKQSFLCFLRCIYNNTVFNLQFCHNMYLRLVVDIIIYLIETSYYTSFQHFVFCYLFLIFYFCSG